MNKYVHSFFIDKIEEIEEHLSTFVKHPRTYLSLILSTGSVRACIVMVPTNRWGKGGYRVD
jgi:hypothetical protein